MLAKVPGNSFLLLPLLLAPVMGGSISGNVTNRATGEGIEGATVFVARETRRPSNGGKQVVTTEAGAFKIEGLAMGST